MARRNPGPAGKASDDIFFERGVGGFPDNPSGFAKNVTADGLRAQLSMVLGISENKHVPEPGATRAPLEASASQAIFFCLQAQDEIANRRLLFHRQGEQFIPLHIKDTLPYFVGAMGEDHYLQRLRYDEARARLRRLERELNEARTLWQTRRRVPRSSLLQEAKRVGLLPADAYADDTEEISCAPGHGSRPPGCWPMPATTIPALDLTDLESRRRRLRGEMQDVKDEIGDVQRLVREASEFQVEASEQQARLASIGLLIADGGDTETCPLCESHLPTAIPSVAESAQIPQRA